IEKAFDLLLPLSGLLSAIVVVIDTIVRQVIWSTYIGTGEYEWSNLRKYQNDYLWLGYIFAALYSIALISVIYGLRKTENEILNLLPNYGRIPVKVKKAKVVVQPTVVAKPVEKPAKAVVEARIGHCSSCGEKIDERFRFCPSCGVQEVGKEAIPKGKFCANCGDTVEKSFRFCPSCGVQFE
ncbi:MAG: zinc ribbon domain-containing protein, partial [Candidatus Heimdallarchaeaceae archaeon]